MKGYKGFDEDLKCSGLQYTIGETTREEEAILCSKGLHFCMYPLDIFHFYEPSSSRYCEIIASDVSEKMGRGSKRVAKELHICKELEAKEIIEASSDYIKDRVQWNYNISGIDENICVSDNYYSISTKQPGVLLGGLFSYALLTDSYSGVLSTNQYSCVKTQGFMSSASGVGSHSCAITTGCRSHASMVGSYCGVLTMGDKSSASIIGDNSLVEAAGESSIASVIGACSKASVTGNRSIASVIGYNSKAQACKGSMAISIGINSYARGAIGSFLVLTECAYIDHELKIKDVQVVKVDGKAIKANTWYTLEGGKPIAYEDC